MAGLLLRPDADDVRARLRTWWHGGNIGRPVLQLTVPRDQPVEDIPEPAMPAGWQTGYSTSDFDYRVRSGLYNVQRRDYLGEAMPQLAPDLAPNCVALFLGCHGVEMPGTVWCEPCIDPEDPESAVFAHDPDNFYWRFALDLTDQWLPRGAHEKFLLQFPDLIEGLDTLAAMRGTDELLYDLIERPEWVHRSLRQITDRYFHYYDVLYDLMRDEVGGSMYWVWAPGRVTKLQCDFSAMIGPDMFGEFMVPVLDEMTRRTGYSLYHWDGPGAIPHLDHLLSLDHLDMIQWTAGAGAEPPTDKRWWPLFRRIIAGGKRIMIGCPDLEALKTLRREFGADLQHFCLGGWAETHEQAQRWFDAADLG